MTKPRLRNAATAANVGFFTLSYENPDLIELGLCFERLAPLLWIRAGSHGRCITEKSAAYDIADTYGILFDIDHSREFIAAMAHCGSVRVVYVLTDDETQYQAVVGQLPDGVESVRLYEGYLQTFRINRGGG